MATRALLHLGDATGRCLFANVQYQHARIRISDSFRLCRSFRRARDVEPTKFFGQTAIQGSGGTSLWKCFAFTTLFSGATIIGATIWEYERIRDHTYRRKGWRGDLQNWWMSLSDGQRIFIPICFINVLVFLAWQVPSLQCTMLRHFCCNPNTNTSCWPMLLSTFSHYSIWHLAANMYVLHSFSTPAVAMLGREQFVALYLTSGIISSFVSNVYKVTTCFPGQSVGASGAIMGIIAFYCMQYPDSRLSIVFLPMITFTAGTAIKALMAVDFTGCLLGWRFFDHAGHLGGALWGLFWQKWGNANIWQNREPILSVWHDIRDKPRSN